MHPVTCTNTHHDITDLVNHGLVKNTKSGEQNKTFLCNKNILNLCLRWHILRSYRFVTEVIFKLTISGKCVGRKLFFIFVLKYFIKFSFHGEFSEKFV